MSIKFKKLFCMFDPDVKMQLTILVRLSYMWISSFLVLNPKSITYVHDTIYCFFSYIIVSIFRTHGD